MNKIKICPSQISGKVMAPSSKSYTHRAVILSSLANGQSQIYNPLISRDTNASIDACKLLGANISLHDDHMIINGPSQLQTPKNTINVENSGTTLRILAGISNLTSPDADVIITGDESIQKRPIQPLLNSLNDIGGKCFSMNGDGHPPIIVKGGGIKGGVTQIQGNISSQFISSLLITATQAEKETIIKLDGTPVSTPYIDMTTSLLAKFGAKIQSDNHSQFIVEPKNFSPQKIQVPGDFSSASILMALAAVNKSKITVTNLNINSIQGDIKILDILREMGAKISINENEITVSSSGLSGNSFNLNDTPDLLPVVAVMALSAEGETIISGVEHARFKESDRIKILYNELSKLGVKIIEKKDGLKIIGTKKLRGNELNCYGDHRLFMVLCVASTICDTPCIINGAESIDISYPLFLRDIKQLGVEVIYND